MKNVTPIALRRLRLILALLAAPIAPCLAQSAAPSEQELMAIRAKMSEEYMEAMKAHDIVKAADHYSTDAVFALLSPNRSITVGREAMMKRYAETFDRGAVINYTSKPTEAHLMGDGTAWTSGTYSFTAVGKDGSTRDFHGNWVDQMRRDPDGVWRVTFQANASIANP